VKFMTDPVWRGGPIAPNPSAARVALEFARVQAEHVARICGALPPGWGIWVSAAEPSQERPGLHEFSYFEAPIGSPAPPHPGTWTFWSRLDCQA
jgi:hypothetical protein